MRLTPTAQTKDNKATRSSPIPTMTHDRTEDNKGPISSLACFPFDTMDGAALGLFAPAPILSTPTLGEVTVVTAFDTEAKEDATVFGEMPVLGTASTPSNDLDCVTFTIDTLADLVRWPSTFTCFDWHPAPAPCFIFLAASSFVSELGAKRGPYGTLAQSKTQITLP
jgi:hypothetical protein